MHAAVQHFHGTIAPLPAPLQRFVRLASLPVGNWPIPRTAQRMSETKPREFVIQGVTLNGRAFRPSDWAERLAGALSSFRPKGGASGIGAHIGYSPYCVPRVIDNVKCVIVNEALRSVEPMAWDFAMNFARDNELQVAEVCWLPDQPTP